MTWRQGGADSQARGGPIGTAGLGGAIVPIWTPQCHLGFPTVAQVAHASESRAVLCSASGLGASIPARDVGCIY